MTYQRKILGNWGEERAEALLIQKGYQILGHQIHTKIGEIDLLAQDGMTLVVVEVKTKKGRAMGAPEDMIDWKKQRKLIRLAKEVNQRFPTFGIRIDVVAIEGEQARHYVSAVEDNC